MKKRHAILMSLSLAAFGNAGSTPLLGAYDNICFQSTEFGTVSATPYGTNATLSSLEVEFSNLVSLGNIPKSCPEEGSDARSLFFMPAGHPNPSTVEEKSNLLAILMPLAEMRTYMKAVRTGATGTRPTPPNAVWTAILMPLNEYQAATKARWSQTLESASNQLILDWKASRPTP